MKNKILLVDDEKGIVTMMKNYFEMSGYQVYCAYGGEEVLEKIACQPDIILLDINMPEIDGISVCRRIREHIACPILFITARIESKDKIIGLQAGADDYIVKPFDIEELGARVEAHLRREQRKQKRSVVRFFDELAIDYLKREVTVNGNAVQLSKKEFEIVELLSMNAGQVFDRERIYEAVWGIDGEGSRILSWSISGKSDQNYPHILRIAILIRYGGWVINGTDKADESKKNFLLPDFIVFADCTHTKYCFRIGY